MSVDLASAAFVLSGDLGRGALNWVLICGGGELGDHRRDAVCGRLDFHDRLRKRPSDHHGGPSSHCSDRHAWFFLHDLHPSNNPGIDFFFFFPFLFFLFVLDLVGLLLIVGLVVCFISAMFNKMTSTHGRGVPRVDPV